MASRRKLPPPVPELRRELAARLREAHAQFGTLRLLTDEAGEAVVVRRAGPSEWSRQADQLEAGEAVELSGWEFRRLVPTVDAQKRYRLEADGSLTLIPWNTTR